MPKKTLYNIHAKPSRYTTDKYKRVKTKSKYMYVATNPKNKQKYWLPAPKK